MAVYHGQQSYKAGDPAWLVYFHLAHLLLHAKKGGPSGLCSQQRVWLAVLTVVCGDFVHVMWFGMNSDRDNVHPLITQLIPAGHCTCQTSTSFQCSDCFSCLTSDHSPDNASFPAQTYDYAHDAHNLSLNKDQCNAFFPGLFEDIHQGVGHWQRTGITTKDLNATPGGKD